MRRKRPTLVGPSERFGWGLFSRYKIPKGGFVVEYYGEMISHEEADRRGYLYDLIGNSSLFDLSTDFVVDAGRVCNEARFINHAAKKYANLQPEHLTVNGDRRMLFFANQDIPAQTELTFDYNDGSESEKTFHALKDGGPPEDSRKRKNSKGKKRGGAHKMLKKPPS
jgi:histone-lysine N-methyltransferase EZH2